MLCCKNSTNSRGEEQQYSHPDFFQLINLKWSLTMTIPEWPGADDMAPGE
jgi:hypothetical protein